MFDTNEPRWASRGGLDSTGEGELDVGDPAREPRALRLRKTKVTEDAAASSSIASTTAARARAAHALLERVDEEIASEARPALSTIGREPRQKVNRHRVWHPTPKPPRAPTCA